MSNTSTETAPTLREGDMYRFSYSEESRAKWRTDPHWCFDGQVVVKGGQLVDTYWGSNDSRVVKPSEGTLTFVCNLNDVRDIQNYETRYYAEADVFNLSSQHGCHKRYVVRNNATRSKDRMLEWLHAEAYKKRRDVDSLVHSLERLAVQISRVEAGDTTISIG